MVNATPRPLYPRERDPVRIVQEAGWAPGPVWTGTENLAFTRGRTLDRPVCSESLYRLRYPGRWPAAYEVRTVHRGRLGGFKVLLKDREVRM